jgi:hypothetical protein
VLEIVSGPTLNSEIQKEKKKSGSCLKTDQIESLVLYVYEDKLCKIPQIEIVFSHNCKAIAILDTGSEVNLLSERIYIELTKAGINIPILPIEGVVLVTAFGKHSSKIRKQALTEFTIRKDQFEGVFMISPQFTNDVIL